MLLNSLGEVVTLQIDLLGTRPVEEILKTEFNDAEASGLYVNNMILQRINEDNLLNYHSIFDKIVEILGDYEGIDSVTALIRMMVNNDPIEVTVQLVGNHQSPNIMQSSDQTRYFEIINLIKTKWALTSRFGIHP